MSTPPKDRQWKINGDPFFVDTDEELAAALNECITILGRVGGAILIAADRAEIDPGHYVTTQYIFKWSSFVPAKRQPVNEDQGGDNA